MKKFKITAAEKEMLIKRRGGIRGTKEVLTGYFFELGTVKQLRKDILGLLNDTYFEGYKQLPKEDEDYDFLLKVSKYATKKWKSKLLRALKALPGKGKLPQGKDPDIDMPTMWLETSDAFDMAEEGDWSGIDSVLGELLDYLKEDVYDHIKTK